MNLETIIGTAIGVILGGVITLWVSRHYYKKSGDELLKESKKLKLTSDLIMYKLQYPDAPTELKRNENGEVVGLIVPISAKGKPIE